MASGLAEQNKRIVSSLYRQSLRLSKSWINRRDLWRAKALEIRQEFDSNKNITDRRQVHVSGRFVSQLKTY
jgi:NADH dehydrogenase (ubiquinone) 1 beta subcomplex subunit 9